MMTRWRGRWVITICRTTWTERHRTATWTSVAPISLCSQSSSQEQVLPTAPIIRTSIHVVKTYCITALRMGVCTDSSCPMRHDITRCELCNCSFLPDSRLPPPTLEAESNTFEMLHLLVLSNLIPHKRPQIFCLRHLQISCHQWGLAFPSVMRIHGSTRLVKVTSTFSWRDQEHLEIRSFLLPIAALQSRKTICGPVGLYKLPL